MKLVTLYSDYHTLLKNWFVDSIKDNWDLGLTYVKTPEAGVSFSQHWYRMMALKTRLVRDAIQDNWGQVILYSDIDVQFLAPAAELLKEAIGDCDMAFMQDSPDSINAGFVAIRANQRTRDFWQFVCQQDLSKYRFADQTLINQLLRSDFSSDLNWCRLPYSFWNPCISDLRFDVVVHHATCAETLEKKIEQLEMVRRQIFSRNVMRVTPERFRKSHQPDELPAADRNLYDRVVDRPFRFVRGDGVEIGARFELNRGGSVGGYRHPNETKWRVHNARIELLAAAYAISSRLAPVGNGVFSGPYLVDAKVVHQLQPKILNEIAAAKVCLLNPDKKMAYDAALRTELSFRKKRPARRPSRANLLQARPLDSITVDRQLKRKKSPLGLTPTAATILVGCVVLSIAAVVLIAMNSNSSPAVAELNEQQARPAIRPRPATPSQTIAEDTRPRIETRQPVAPLRVSEAGTADDEPIQQTDNLDADARSPDAVDVDAAPSASTDSNHDDAKRTAPEDQSGGVLSGDGDQGDGDQGGAVQAPGGPESTDLLPVPGQADQEKAQELIKKQYQASFASAKSEEDKLAIAKTLLDDGKLCDDETNAYVLLRLASATAAFAGDFETALSAIDSIGEMYQVDKLEMKVIALRLVEKSIRGSDATEKRVQLSERAGELADAAVASNQYQAAEELIDIALTSARKARQTDAAKAFAKRKEEIEQLAAAYESVIEAASILDDRPQDSKANFTVGRFLCFIKGEWSQGLPKLAVCDDPILRVTAKKDLSGPSEPQEQVSLGNSWWRIAEMEEGIAQYHARQRAVSYYEQAFPRLPLGPDKDLVTERLAEANSEGSRKTDEKKGLAGAVLALTFDSKHTLVSDSTKMLRDVSGKNHHATVGGAVQFQPGMANQAIFLDGESGLTVGSMIQADFTISFWIRTNQPSRDARSFAGGVSLIDAEVSGVADDFAISMSSGSVMFGIGNPDTNLRGKILVADGKWHHCCVVREKSSGKFALLIDGQMQDVSVASTNALDGSQRIGIGQRGNGPQPSDAPRFRGLMDELVIFNRVLSPHELQLLFTTTKSGRSLADIISTSAN